MPYKISYFLDVQYVMTKICVFWDVCTMWTGKQLQCLLRSIMLCTCIQGYAIKCETLCLLMLV